MDSPMTKIIDASKCPLCGQPTDCQLCTVAAYKGPCWCETVKIPAELISQVAPELLNKACICHSCVVNFHRTQNNAINSQEILPGDCYVENGLSVFTAAYHLRRGYCCGSGCRHCPYVSCTSARRS
jgi:Family of unknown function (DUF5522)/Cysteine-rich CWC